MIENISEFISLVILCSLPILVFLYLVFLRYKNRKEKLKRTLTKSYKEW